MKKRTRNLSLFALPKELQNILEAFLEESSMQLCVAHKKESSWSFESIPLVAAMERGQRELYMCHPTLINRKLDSLAGVPQVWLPELTNDSLTMSVVSLLESDDSSLDSETRKLGTRTFEALRQTLSNVTRKGVWGRNSRTGGEHFYSDILISDEAAGVRERGIRLIPQFADGYVTFDIQSNNKGL